MSKKIEEILGVAPFSGERVVPGTVNVEGREYWYIEDEGSEGFDSLFHKVVTAIQPPLHTRGGALTGGCEITLPDGRRFHALSYKGDVDGWRKQIAGGAIKLNVAAARVVNGMLVFSENEAIPLSACKARFY